MSASQQVMLGGGLYGKTLMQVLTDATLTTNLKLCLDAGDSASYDPAVQTDKWLDRSGGGYDFCLGSGTGVDASDPTFNGSAGSLQSYWSSDGGDRFTYDTTNETWMQSLHKNSAIFSCVFFVNSSASSEWPLFCTSDGGTTGILITLLFGRLYLSVLNGTTTVLSADALNTALSEDRYHMIGVSLNEATGAGGGFLYADGVYDQVGGSDTFNSTYTSPSAGNAGITASCFYGAPTGSRIAAMAVWQGTALTKANMDTIWAAMRGRFGI